MKNETTLKTFNETLYENEIKRADMVYLRQPINGVWHDFTWKETMRQARIITSFLKSLGLNKGDRVSILSKNCAEWFITDFAIAMGGFVSVPLYSTQHKDTISYILNHSDAKAIFVGKLDNWQIQEPGIPENMTRIAFPYDNPMPAKYHWSNILAQLEPDMENHVPDMKDLYTICYTSGTTGEPKGVMIPFESQANLVDTFKNDEILHRVETHHFMSYLPLGHITERMAIETTSIFMKSVVYFAESLPLFSQNIQFASPTIFFAAPRIWAQFQKAILAKLPQSKLNIILNIPLVGSFIRKKIKKTLGLGRSYWNLSGSAPLSEEVMAWYRNLGIYIYQGYGRTEDLAYVSFLRPGETAFASTGKPRPGVEVKLGEHNELLTRSKMMMSGYFKDPESTKQAFTPDGFLRTGDQAQIDSQGYITILGRVKDPFKTDKGEFVNPIPIEGKFGANTLIEQSCLIGITLPQPVLLVVLSQSAKNMDKNQVEENLQKTLNSINPNLTKFEKVSHIIVAKEAWTPENNLLTPTLKMKRNDIHAKYIDFAHEIIKKKSPVAWE